MDKLDFKVIDIVYSNIREKYVFLYDFFINGIPLKEILKDCKLSEGFNIRSDAVFDFLNKKSYLFLNCYYSVKLVVSENKGRIKWRIFCGDKFVEEFHFEKKHYQRIIDYAVSVLKYCENVLERIENAINIIEDDPEDFSIEREEVFRYKLDKFDCIKRFDLKALREAISHPYFEFDYVENRSFDKWWWNLDRIRDGSYPESYMPDHLFSYYAGFKNFIKDKVDLPYFIQELYRNQFSGKIMSDDLHIFLIKGLKDYLLAFDCDGNLSFVPDDLKDRNFTEFPFDRKILISIGSEFNFGFDRILRIKNFFEELEKKRYVYGYSVIKDLIPDRSIVSIVMDNFSFPEAANFFLEAEYGSFDTEFHLLKDSEDLAFYYFENMEKYYTRVVGTKYTEDSCVDEIKEKDEIFTVWEDKNPHDKYALKVLNKKGEKIGYIRKSIAYFMNKLFRKKPFLIGEVVDNSKEIFIKIYLKEKNHRFKR